MMETERKATKFKKGMPKFVEVDAKKASLDAIRRRIMAGKKKNVVQNRPVWSS